jgi:hypothetical protein
MKNRIVTILNQKAFDEYFRRKRPITKKTFIDWISSDITAREASKSNGLGILSGPQLLSLHSKNLRKFDIISVKLIPYARPKNLIEIKKRRLRGVIFRNLKRKASLEQLEKITELLGIKRRSENG